MNFRLIKFVARKLSGANKRQRLLNFARIFALLSVMLGSMALIISLSVLDGFETMLKEKAVKFTSHININSAADEYLPYSDKVLKMLPKKFSEISAVAPVIKKEGLIRSKSFIDGALIQGYKSEYDITNMKDNIIRGAKSFSSDSAKEIFIGERLAIKLGVDLNDTLIAFATNSRDESADLFPEIEQFRITGIYKTGMAKYDDIMVYIPFDRARIFFNLPENIVSAYEVMTKDLDNVTKLSFRINSFLEMPFYCTTVFQLHGSIFAWIELQKAPIPIVLGLISVVAVFNIITILLITVVEKTHSIGILRALGMKNKDILSVFIFQGVSIGFIGTLLGSLLGLIFGILQNEFGLIGLKGDIYFLDVLPVDLSPWHFIIVVGVSLILSFLATLIPAMIAVKVRPIKAIRFK